MLFADKVWIYLSDNISTFIGTKIPSVQSLVAHLTFGFSINRANTSLAGYLKASLYNRFVTVRHFESSPVRIILTFISLSVALSGLAFMNEHTALAVNHRRQPYSICF
jgi:hypothetical protein